MKNLFYLLLTYVVLQSCKQQPYTLTSTVVSGTIENNSNYCGGAAPSEELLQELLTYQPSANQTFYVRQGTVAAPFSGVYLQFTTDANGNYSISLPDGNYTVVCQEKYNLESSPSVVDSSCSYLHTADFNFVVSSSLSIQNKQYTKTCNYDCLGTVPN